jgi:hypothetical protein
MHLTHGIIRRFDPTAWRAEVELVGAPGALLPGVPVGAHLGPELLPPGAAVWLCLSDEGNPADGAVLAPYGGPPAPWVTSRLWRPSLAVASLSAPVACTATAYEEVAGLRLGLTLDATSSVLLLLAATGRLDQTGSTHTLAFFHDDGHEATELSPVETVGGPGAPATEDRALTWLALQSGVVAGSHSFALKHRVSAGQATLQQARVVAVVMAE